jgi:hypothetical protein
LSVGLNKIKSTFLFQYFSHLVGLAFQGVAGKFKRMQFLVSYEEAKQFECGCINTVVQKDSISLSIIVVFE